MDLSLLTIFEQLSHHEQEVLQTLVPDAPTTEELVTRLTSVQRLSPVVASLSPTGQDLLSQWLIHDGMISPYYRVTAQEFTQTIQILSQSGIVFERFHNDYRAGYVIAPDYLRPLTALLFPVKNLIADVQEDRANLLTVAIWDGFYRDVFQVMHFAQTEPLLLTQQGTVYKRVQSKILGQLTRTTPQHLDSIVQFLKDQALATLDAATRQIHITDEASEQLWNSSPHQRWNRYLQFVMHQIESDSRGLLVFHMLDQLAPDQWLDARKLDHFLSGYRTPGYTINPSIFNLLAILDTYDVIDYHPPFLRLSRWAYGAQRGYFEEPRRHDVIIQPTGEILIPPETPFDERWHLSTLAKIVRPDRMLLMQVDRPSITRAVTHGWTGEKARHYLQTVSRVGLPDNLAANLADWFQALTHHQFVRATIIHSQTPTLSEQIERLLRHQMVARLSPTDLIIPDNVVEQVHHMLSRRGLHMLKTVWEPSHVPEILETGPTISIHIPQRSRPRAASPAVDPKKVILQALDTHAYLRVRYIPTGMVEEVTMKIIPFRVVDDWIYGISERRETITFNLRQILDITPD